MYSESKEIILILNAKQRKIILYYIIILSVNMNKNMHSITLLNAEDTERR
jgi:hypothetical protein